MTRSAFDNKVLIEQVRSLESLEALTSEATQGPTPGTVGHDFNSLLLQRAKRLVVQHALQDTLAHAPRVWRMSNFFTGAAAVILGIMATLYAVSGGSTINIYWLLLVLIGFNFLSIVLWLIGIGTGLNNLVGGVLPKLSTWLSATLARRHKSTSVSDLAWLRCNFGGAVGKWRLSQVTQQIWLLYLSAGLLALMLVLTARQFDFVWGTTLLADTSFMRLTGVLSEPLQMLGLHTPNPQQVLETRIGSGYPLTAEHRQSWAQFLIGALLVFGILPRLLLWLVCRGLLAAARARYELDYYLPYYVNLRQQLIPMHGRSEIVDADTAPTSQSNSTAVSADSAGQMSHLPAGVKWVAVELGEAVNWPLDKVNPTDNLGQVVDRQSLEQILQSSSGLGIAIALAASRTPDRGVKRTISNLVATAKSTWLVLIESPGSGPISQARLTAWYRLAQECHVPAANVVLVQED